MDGGTEVQTFPAYALSNPLHSCRRSEFLLRAPPSDSKVCVGALSLARLAKSYMSCRCPLRGFGTCRLAGGLACGLPVPAYCAGVLVACLVVTARVQREQPQQRPGAGCCAAILVAHPVCCAMASHGAHASLRHALRGVQKRPHAACAQFRPHSETSANTSVEITAGACSRCSLASRRAVHLIQSEGSARLEEIMSPYCTSLVHASACHPWCHV